MRYIEIFEEKRDFHSKAVDKMQPQEWSQFQRDYLTPSGKHKAEEDIIERLKEHARRMKMHQDWLVKKPS